MVVIIIILLKMIEQILTLLIMLTLYLSYTWIYWPLKTMKSYTKYLQEKNYKVLQSPYNPFKLDMVTQFRKGNTHGDAMKIYKENRCHYDVVVCNSLNMPRLEIYHPDFIKEYYAVDKHYEYPKAKRVAEIFSRIGGYGLPFTQGQVWHRKRRILNKIFNFDFIKSQTTNIANACSQAIRQIQKMSKKSSSQDQTQVQYNIIDLTARMFSSVMMESFLGGTHDETIDGEPAGEFVKDMVKMITEQAFHPVNVFLGPKFCKLGITPQQRRVNRKIKLYQKWGLAFIRKRIALITQNILSGNIDPNPNDIIQALIRAKYSSKQSNQQSETMVTQAQIFEQFTAFFIAGTDTTSNFAQMMIYAVAGNEKIEAKVREEIEKYMGEEDYSYENLKNFKYVDMLQKQVTRCSGPGTHLFSRVACRDNYLNGLPVKKGTSFTIMNLGIHYNPAYFPDPLQLRPERWQSECNDLPNYVLGGFSAGARTCIGKHLAFLESKIALIKFMKRYKKIKLGIERYKMIFKFVYSPEDFQSTMTIDSNYNL